MTPQSGTCPQCGSGPLDEIYGIDRIPVFQNKVYASAAQARQAVCGPVSLLACPGCGFVFNGRFDASLMSYDQDYQNEQSHSPVFDDYLDAIVDRLVAAGYQQKKVVEIGCGKGTFLNKLWQRGFDAIGFDTAYEGDDPRVHREYFSARHRGMSIDLVILRHTLEHIARPLDFLRDLAGHCPPRAGIYIEVPSFEWIIAKRAFWDVFFEHCNYFTQQSLGAMFATSSCDLLFGDQYMALLAPLGELLPRARVPGSPDPMDLSVLAREIDVARRFVRTHPGLLVWGAGAKGATFVNITDPDCEFIKAVVDINPKKTGRHVAGTGHPIIAAQQIAATGATDVLIMNENYRAEIMAMAGSGKLRFHTLGVDSLSPAD
ncbi:MAG: hypothetical protein RLZZ385_1535 [Pseudomonadota bacterium]|jgi:SAM-dependent methyltransferase